MTSALLAAEPLEYQYRAVISAAIRNHPRSQQEQIGPSGLGEPCARRLIRMLTGTDNQKRGWFATEDPWVATVGTAVHAWLAEAFAGDARFRREQRVVVGQVGGVDIGGNCDLYDVEARVATDWKVVGAPTLEKVERAGPSPGYRAQIHLYGRGLELLGWPVEQVQIAFLPRNTNLSGGIWWSEPYDEGRALDVLERADGLLRLALAVGVDAASQLYPPCNPKVTYCPYCPTR